MSFNIYPIGDSSATIDLGNYISEALNQKIIAMQHWLQQNPFDGLKDIIIGYSSLTVVYQTWHINKIKGQAATVFDFVKDKLETAYHQAQIMQQPVADAIRIPVLYDGIDLSFIASEKQLGIEDIIHLHVSKTYRVYLIGFLPGFSYMASVDERIAIPRKQKPVAVPAGSVGIAGDQTGIYPLDSPGGWQIIGRTPLKLFNPANNHPVLLKAGDEVAFYAINKEEYEALRGW